MTKQTALGETSDMRYYQEHREERIRASREWAVRNAAWVKQRRAAYRLRNLDEINRKQKAWREKNKEYSLEQCRAFGKKYYKKNKDFIIHRTGVNRDKRRGAIGSHSFEQWMEIRNASPICSMCGRFVECKNLTKDHIIPIKKGGTENIDNIQAICGPCNSRKRDRVFARISAGVE